MNKGIEALKEIRENSDEWEQNFIDRYAAFLPVTYDEFMQLWNDGGYKLFFKNWAIVCSL